jgi:AcrR family transcriptional regulator
MSKLSRDDWVKGAQKMLVELGPSALSIVKLSASLGVTRGSFYYHFVSLNALIDGVISDWECNVVDKGFADARSLTQTPLDEIYYLIDFVTRLSDKQDLVLRQWATHNTHVKKHMERLDEKRLAVMTDVFGRFTGDQKRGEVFGQLAFYAYIGCLNSYPRPSSEKQKQVSLEILNLLESELASRAR